MEPNLWPMGRVRNGVLWFLGTGAQWRELPSELGPFQTVQRRFRHCVREGKLEQVLRRLSEELYSQGKRKLAEAFIDVTFAPAKKGELAIGPTKRGKGTKSMTVADHLGLALAPACGIGPASPHDSRLVESTPGSQLSGQTAAMFDRRPRRSGSSRASLVGRNSGGLDRYLAREPDIEIIATRRRTQDGRLFRRYLRRWKIERRFAWLGAYRRLGTG